MKKQSRLVARIRRLSLRERLRSTSLADLLITATDKDVRRLERVIESMVKSAGPRPRRGRPPFMSPLGYRELVWSVDSIKQLCREPMMTDKEAIERHVYVCYGKQSGEKRRKLVKSWRSRLASARKKSRK